MFIGEFEHVMDIKGRLAIPAKFRKALLRGAVVTRGLDDSLFLFDIFQWKKLATKIALLPFSQANMRAFTRLMLAGAMEVIVDTQGRIMIPQYLRTYAKLKKDVVFVGLYNRVEIWDNALWKQYRQKSEKESEKIAETLGSLGM